MKKYYSLFIVFFIVTFSFFTPGCSTQASPAPEVSANHWINTDSFSLADHSDKIVVLEFWATWCPPCRQIKPHIKQLNETYKDQGVVFVSISNENAQTVEAFVNQSDMDWIVAAESSSGADYNVSAIPAAFIVVDGMIVWSGNPAGGMDAEIERLVSERQN